MPLPDLTAQQPAEALHVSEPARVALRAHDWPGNIRELGNAMERATILCDHATIEPRDLGLAAGDPGIDGIDLSGTLSEATERATRMIETIKLRDALSRTTSRAEAAELLGIAPRTLAAKLKELGMMEE